MKPATYLTKPERKIDHIKTGDLMRKLRERAGISIRGAAMRLQISHTMLADLEEGRRNWTAERCDRLEEIYNDIIHKDNSSAKTT